MLPKQTFAVLIRFSGVFFFLAFLLLVSAVRPPVVFADVKEETLQKYDRIISKTKEMNLAGYNLKPVAPKMRQMTDFLLANDFLRTGRLLDEIGIDLTEIEKRGPDALRREKRYAFLAIFGDVLQQCLLFVLTSILILRSGFVRRMILAPRFLWGEAFRLILVFVGAALAVGLLSFIRYSQSSWAFIDLQILFIALSGMIGGIGVGLAAGLTVALLRFLISPGLNPFDLYPVMAPVLCGVFHRFSGARPYSQKSILAAGFMVGLTHSLFIYLPFARHISFPAWLGAVLFVTAGEAGLFAAFFFIHGFFYREDKNKATERELLSMQLQFLRAQINPHFLFNAFNTIAAICGEDGSERARGLVLRLSSLFRGLSRGENDHIPLREELDYIDNYLEIEKVRFGSRLRIEKDVRLSETALRMQVPILVIQPIVENAVKHGLSNKKGGGTLRLTACEEGDRIAVEVGDDGVGMSPGQIDELFSEGPSAANGIEGHAGIGLRNIRRRMAGIFGARFDLRVNSQTGQGTVVKIIFPRS